MPSEKDNVLEFSQYMQPDKMSYIICADIESLTKEVDGCANNPGIFSTTKAVKHIPCGYSMPRIWAFDHIENKHTLKNGKEEVLWIFKRIRAKYKLLES